jgi:hypothetical protein
LSQSELAKLKESEGIIRKDLANKLSVGDKATGRVTASLDNQLLKIELLLGDSNTAAGVRSELQSLKSSIAGMLSQIASGWPSYRIALTTASLYRVQANILARQNFINQLGVYVGKVQAASTLAALNAIPKPTLAAVPSAPPTQIDPCRGWEEGLAAIKDKLKSLEQLAKINPAQGICMLPGSDSEHDDEDHDHQTGHHDTCGCEKGVVTVHGQKMKLPEATRVISADTKMSDIISDLKEDEVLEIDHGATLTFDVVSDKKVRAIVAYGSLTFATDLNTKLRVGDLIVAPTGKLSVGAEQAPIGESYTAQIVIADYPLDRLNDPYQLGRSIIGLGEVEMYGRKITDPGIAPAASPKAGDTSIVLSQSPGESGWRVGDTVVVADTRQLAKGASRAYISQTEYRTILEINGSRINLDKPLAFDHPGIMLPDISGKPTIARQIDVINTSRNVQVSSESLSGARGHTMFTDRAKVNIQYVTFKDLGRTIDGDLDNTECDSQGRLRNYGYNQIGRYAFHTHHLTGPNNPTNTGYQFKLVGATFEGSLKWALAIHNSSFGRIEGNVFHRNPGTALALEDGDEAYNEVIHNWFVGTAPGDETFPDSLLRRGGRTINEQGGDFSFEGRMAIWDAPLNTFKDNRIYGHFGVGYQLNEYYDTAIRTPKFRGADLNDANSWINWGAKTNDDHNRTAAVPVGEKSDNLIVGSIAGFYEAWPRGMVSRSQYAESPAVFERFIIANVQEGVHAYHTSHSEYKDFVMINDPKVANNYPGNSRYTTAFNFASSSYEAANMRIISEHTRAVVANSEGAADANGVYSGTYVANFHIGIDGIRNSKLFGSRGSSTENTTTVAGGQWLNFVNFKVNLATDPTALVTRISDVDLYTPTEMKKIPGFTERPINILMDYSLIKGGNYTHVLTSSRAFINGWTINGVRAPDYRVYYLEQNPNFKVPISSDIVPRVQGASEPNLTNEHHLIKYGTSIAQAIAPCDRGGVTCEELRSQGEQWGIYGLVEQQQ